MKKILLLLSLFSVCVTYGQSASKSNVHYDDSRVIGSFYYNIKGDKVEQHININYVLSPAPFTNTLHFVLGTAEPLAMHANVVNAAGVAVLKWAPAAVSYKYMDQFDISSLPVGKYHMDVFAGNSQNRTYSIPFEKK